MRLITDGYTLPGRVYIPHLGELRFVFRPVTFEEWQEVLDHISSRDPKELTSHRSELLAGHLKSWNAVGDDDKAAAVTPANVAALPEPALDRLSQIMSLRRPSDPEPGKAGEAAPTVGN